MSEFDEIRRSKIIDLAVYTAECVILDNIKIPAAEIDYLIAGVALKLMQKVQSRLLTNLLAKDFLTSSGPGR